MGAISGAGLGPVLIGWISSSILVPTLAWQTYTQWKSGSSRGVSVWLYLGSLLSSSGFIIYSGFLHNAVFMVTNALMVVNNILGLCVIAHHRRRRSAQDHRQGARQVFTIPGAICQGPTSERAVVQ